jgi:hypothetical protein
MIAWPNRLGGTVSPVVALALALGVFPPVSAHATLAEIAAFQVDSLIKRTQTTDATYALVSAVEIRRDDATVHEFAAEFNQGDLHRVETPRDRIVTNCRTGSSAHLAVATGQITHEDGLSGVACGIYTGDIVRSAAATGSRESPFGRLQQLKIETHASTRTYEVAPNGAIVSETITDLNGKLRLINKTISLSGRLPSGDMFSEASLTRSVVPDELQKKASDPSNWRAH